MNQKIEKLFQGFITKNKLKFITGIPDSTLTFLENLIKKTKISHKVSVNEGNAIAMACGYYLKTKKIPIIYMQNSGLGNAINPLTSLVNKEVYSIPMLILLGWRGCAGSQDEAQHKLMGKITLKLLNLMNLNYTIINKDITINKLNKIYLKILKEKKPYFLVFKYNKKNKEKLKIKKNNCQILRYNFLNNLLRYTNNRNYKIFSTTGFTSREVFKIINENKFKSKNFYMPGSMGHCFGLSSSFNFFSTKKERVLCLDGDGSFLMHLGSLTSILKKNSSFKYFLLNNLCHESVGNIQSSIQNIKIKEFSKSINFDKYFKIKKMSDFDKIKNNLKTNKNIFFEILIKNQTIRDLPRIKDFENILKNFF